MLAAPGEFEYILCGFGHYLPGTITCGGRHKAGGWVAPDSLPETKPKTRLRPSTTPFQ